MTDTTTTTTTTTASSTSTSSDDDDDDDADLVEVVVVVERDEPLHYPSIVFRILRFICTRIVNLFRWITRYISTRLRDPRHILFELTPDNNPLLWFFVNGFVVLYSLFLLATVYHYETSEHRKERKDALKFADQSYLVYDFATTTIWVIETVLGCVVFLKGGGEHHWFFSKFVRVVHLIIALVFLSDSLNTLQEWKWKKEDIEVDALWVLADLLAYLLALIETAVLLFFSWRRRQQRQQADDDDHQLLITVQQEINDTSSATGGGIGGTVHHDPLLAKLLPFYDSVQSEYFERRSTKRRSLKVEDWTQLFEALYPHGMG